MLDSRGRPTVECDVELADGARGRASVPSGASTGSAEAHELRDGDPRRYGGRGVLKAVAHVNGALASLLRGADARDQAAIDALMRDCDGTPSLERLGANAVLAVSLAVCRAAAASLRRPLHEWIGTLAGEPRPLLPLPMINMLSGGLHAAWGMDVQDILAMPAGAGSLNEAIRSMAALRTAAAEELAERGGTTLLADEGGLSPGCARAEDAFELLLRAAARAGLRAGEDVLIAVDVAASALRAPTGEYRLDRAGARLDSAQMIGMMEDWAARYPIASIEDGLAEEDWEGWTELTRRLGGAVQLVGDDLFATHAGRLEKGRRAGAANAVLVKLNQNGTLSGTLEVIARARAHGYAAIVSARSGETEDSFIADLAVGSGAGQIKIGSLRTSNTLAKYNQLLRIEEESGASYAGDAILRQRRP